MEKFNLLYRETKNSLPKILKRNVTEEQVDEFWKSLNFWEREHIIVERIKEREER